MQRISSWTEFVAAGGLFRYGSAVGGKPPTPLKAEWLNMVQEEMANFILAYLPELDATDNTQLLKAIQAFGTAFPLKATTLAGYGIVDAYTKPEADWLLSKKANNAITLAGYGIGDAYTKPEANLLLSEKANNATTLAGYGIVDAYTKPEADLLLSEKANNATTLAGYGIVDAYTKPEADWQLSKKANNAITLAGYGIGDAYTKVVIDAALAALQAAVDSLSATKQDKNTALMAPTGWRLDKATGFLEQWGSGYVAPNSQPSAIDFPTPFAEVYNCLGSKVTPNSIDDYGNAVGALAVSVTQYKLFNDSRIHGATIHWRAIGKAPGY